MIRFSEITSATPWAPTPMKTVDFECYHCHATTRVAAQTVENAEANYWRLRYEALLGQLNATLQMCQMLHGDDPMRVYWENQMIAIRERFTTDQK